MQWLEAGGDLTGGLRRALRALALDPARSFSWDPARPPYPGLAAFEPEDAAVFFGREAEVKDLVRRLHPTLQRGADRLGKFWDSHVLLLGQPARDPTMRPLARLLWRDEEATARSWAIARDATTEDKERWHRHGIELVNADPATYIEHIEHQLTSRSLG